MSKKQISRRDFLKRVGQGAFAAALAGVLKFVPEARGLLAKGAKNNSGPIIEELAGTSLDEVIKVARAHSDGEAMWQHLLGKGYTPREATASATKISAATSVKVPFVGLNSQQQALFIFGFSKGQVKVGAGFYSGQPTNVDIYAAENGKITKESQIRRMANGAIQVQFATGKTVDIAPPPRFSAKNARPVMNHDPQGCMYCSWAVGVVFALGCGVTAGLACLPFGPVGAVICSIVWSLICLVGGVNGVDEICVDRLGYCS